MNHLERGSVQGVEVGAQRREARYEAPQVIYETQLEVRAGSCGTIPDLFGLEDPACR